jgi:ADP-heptose:LPS heptosyltransferase
MMQPSHPLHPAPRRIAIFRALQLGDMLCAVPALRALRQACPDAHITLIGLPSAQPFVARFPQYVDALMTFPGIAQFPEQQARPQSLPDFYRAARERGFDLAIQMHGSGGESLPIVRKLGARRVVGFVPRPDQAAPRRLMPWPDHLPEPLRYTSLMRFLGIPVANEELELPLTAADHGAALDAARTGSFDPARTVFFHPGARLPSRRWPLERHAAVAAALALDGWTIAVTGSPDEVDLTRALVGLVDDAAGGHVVDLGGRTSLGALAALLSRAPLLVCNDTAVSHVAAARGTRSVVVACGSDTRRWAPPDSGLHTVLADYPTCRPCSYHECPVGHPCALNVQVEQVLAAARMHLKARSTVCGTEPADAASYSPQPCPPQPPAACAPNPEAAPHVHA